MTWDLIEATPIDWWHKLVHPDEHMQLWEQCVDKDTQL